MTMSKALAGFLLGVAHEYGRATKRKLSTVSVRALADPNFFQRVADGKAFTMERMDAAIVWFAANWPEDAKWPAPPAWPYPTPGAPNGKAREGGEARKSTEAEGRQSPKAKRRQGAQHRSGE